MLRITPKATDSLETRRIRIKTRLNNFTPYTFRVFMRMLKFLADGEPFEVFLEPGSYLMRFVLEWGTNGKIESLEWLIQEILPCNIAIDAKNELPCIAKGVVLIAGGICAAEMFLITNDGKSEKVICGTAKIGNGATGTETFFITNDSRKRMETGGEVLTRGGAVHAVCPVVTNDRNEVFALDGTAAIRGGIVGSAKVVLTNDFNRFFSINGAGRTGGGTVITENVEIKTDEERTKE